MLLAASTARQAIHFGSDYFTKQSLPIPFLGTLSPEMAHRFMFPYKDANKRAYSFGLKPELKHIPASGERGEPVYVYAIFHTKDGGYGFEVCSIDDIRAHAQRYSKSFQNGPWQTNFEEMAKKTVLKRVLKYAPLKSEFLRGLAQDETIKQEISDDMYMVEAAYAEPDPPSTESD